jgi:GNAT superfamily N-acetyltransferase
MSRKTLILFIAVYAVMIVLQSLQIIYSPHRIASALNLTAVIVTSLIVGALVREWMLVRAKEMEPMPVYRHTDDPGEIDLAVELLHRELYAPYGLEKSDWHERGEGDRHFVARLGDEVIAAMILRTGGENAELHHAAVARNHRGKGVGIALWQAVYAHAARNGIRIIDVYSRNTSFGFWRRCGLEAVSDHWFDEKLPGQHPIRRSKMRIEVPAESGSRP